jgi:hypothetical protein
METWHTICGERNMNEIKQKEPAYHRLQAWSDEHEDAICMMIIGVISCYFAGAVILAKLSGAL